MDVHLLAAGGHPAYRHGLEPCFRAFFCARSSSPEARSDPAPLDREPGLGYYSGVNEVRQSILVGLGTQQPDGQFATTLHVSYILSACLWPDMGSISIVNQTDARAESAQAFR